MGHDAEGAQLQVALDRVVADIVFDFSVKPRLSSQRGNAILVAASIYDACKYYTLFQKTPIRGKRAVVTSYNPLASLLNRMTSKPVKVAN